MFSLKLSRLMSSKILQQRKSSPLCPGRAEGQLAGGCLSIVVSTLGTGHEIDTKDKILFFEDIDEKPHRIDRYLTHLIQAGKLQQAQVELSLVPFQNANTFPVKTTTNSGSLF